MIIAIFEVAKKRNLLKLYCHFIPFIHYFPGFFFKPYSRVLFVCVDVKFESERSSLTYIYISFVWSIIVIMIVITYSRSCGMELLENVDRIVSVLFITGSRVSALLYLYL